LNAEKVTVVDIYFHWMACPKLPGWIRGQEEALIFATSSPEFNRSYFLYCYNLHMPARTLV